MVEKIKNFITKYKVQILAICAAIITLATSFMAFGGKTAIACTVVVAIVELIVYYLKNGFTETMATMMVNLVKLIVEIINGQPMTDTKVTSTSKKEIVSLTEDEIKERILEGVK